MFLIKKYSYSMSEANFYISLIYVMSAPLSPIMGFMIDKWGRNIAFCFVAIVGTLIAHLLFAFTFLDPWVAHPGPLLVPFYMPSMVGLLFDEKFPAFWRKYFYPAIWRKCVRTLLFDENGMWTYSAIYTNISRFFLANNYPCVCITVQKIRTIIT